MDKFKALSLVLLGMVIGLGYAVACGAGDDANGTAGPMLPGVGVAMAQAECEQWEVVAFYAEDVVAAQSEGVSVRASLPPGFTPLSATDDGALQYAWAARCAQ